MSSSAAVWHEVECGAFRADLGLWRELAASHPSPVLEVGAGTGRVALELAAAGVDVVALDCDSELLTALEDRAKARQLTNVRTVCADARDFRTDERFGLIAVPMQTIQLFGGAPGRAAFLEGARAILKPDGCLAAAIADMVDGGGEIPVVYPPDMLTIGSHTYTSRPTCVRREREKLVIERQRWETNAAGTGSVVSAREEIDELTPATLEEEALAAGFSFAGRLQVPEAGAYAGSEVVLLSG